MKHTIATIIHNDRTRGFTLIELLVSIAIIATIIGLSLPNYLNARERARDAKKKAEMYELKNALRLYYNDYNKYPEGYNGGVGKINYIKGCGTLGTGNCPCSGTIDFAAGGTGCDTIYMKKLPSDLGSSMYYYQISAGDDFCLKVPLENISDSGLAGSQAKCTGICSSIASSEYTMCAD